MGDIKEIAEPEVAVEVEAEPEVDLSHVPEKVRGHVDPKKYVEDADYKRAIEHGWKPKDVFLEGGGDEADWTGYKVFNRRYDDLQDRRGLQKEIAEMKRSTDAILSSFKEEKERAIREALAEREALLKVAIEDGNAAEAARLQREILETQNSAKPEPKAQMEPLPIIDMRRRNAFINPQSPDFSPEINQEFEAICIARAQQYHKVYGRQLSDLEIKIIADEALDMIKDKVPQKQSAKAPAKAPAIAKPAAIQANAKPKLSSIQSEAYEKILESAGKGAAEAYLKRIQSR